MRRSGEQRRRGEQAAQAQTAAIAAREAAASVFYDMDQAQKYVGGRVTVFTDLDAAAAAPAQRELASLNEFANGAASAYINIVDAHDLDSHDRSLAEYDAARRAFLAVTDQLKRAVNDINGFAARLQPRMTQLEAALDQLPPRLAAARDALAAAESAVAAARTAGMDATDPEEQVAQARAALTVLNSQGLGGLGLDGAIKQAEEVRRLADLAREAAAELPQMAEKVRHSLTAVRTRVEAVSGRVEPVQAAMSKLLRGYSQACWQDLRGAPKAIEDGVTRARERIAEASAHASRNEWKQAQQALTAARTELSGADRRAVQVLGRLADLDAARADPAKPAESARFAVRDAQKLAISAPGGPSPDHARTLDALVARLQAAQDRIKDAPHPDYWAYLQELDAIKQASRTVVDRIRAERSAGR